MEYLMCIISPNIPFLFSLCDFNFFLNFQYEFTKISPERYIIFSVVYEWALIKIIYI